MPTAACNSTKRAPHCVACRKQAATALSASLSHTLPRLPSLARDQPWGIYYQSVGQRFYFMLVIYVNCKYFNKLPFAAPTSRTMWRGACNATRHDAPCCVLSTLKIELKINWASNLAVVVLSHSHRVHTLWQVRLYSICLYERAQFSQF